MRTPPGIYNTCETSSSIEKLTAPPRNGYRVVADSFTLGDTGRVWKAPFRMVAPEPYSFGDDCIEMYVNDIEVMNAAAEFLQRYKPELLAHLAQKLPSDFDERPTLIAKHAMQTAAERTNEERAVAVIPRERAPRLIVVPTISTDHWAYKAHYDPGHGVSGLSSQDQYEGYCRFEADTDTGAALDYIEKYAKLAQNYTGTNLRDAVLCAAFRDPYYTCMEICLLELKLPAHFIALIHYGIGVYKLTGSRFVSPRDNVLGGEMKSSENAARDLALHSDMMSAFECLTQMYLEDFA